MQLLLISQLVIRQKQNRVPIYCANIEKIQIQLLKSIFADPTPSIFQTDPLSILYFMSLIMYRYLLATISVKPEEFFNTTSDLFAITACFYYDRQQLSTYKS